MELILSLLEGIFMAFPSKRQRRFKQKYKQLKRQDWFEKYISRYGITLQCNDQIKDFIMKQDIEQVCSDEKIIVIFKQEMNCILDNDNNIGNMERLKKSL